mmetsp:Transcript_48258/g.111864  ORF Transcript_48258/g.111864 Transcript_48258/m.111864 type:complete len:364 (+) Transcript_48258:91-1182(+)
MIGGSCQAGFGNDTTGLTLPYTWSEFCDKATGKRYFFDTATGRTLWKAPRIIDCSKLAFDKCPKAENLASSGGVASLEVLKPGGNGMAVGCYSPCSKLLFNQWKNEKAKGLPASDTSIAPYCCPTPPESPEACRAGPVKDTDFVKGVHEMCPGVYGYSYDDGMGLLKCTPDTEYEVTFYCPSYKTVPTPPPLHVSRTPCTATTKLPEGATTTTEEQPRSATSTAGSRTSAPRSTTVSHLATKAPATGQTTSEAPSTPPPKPTESGWIATLEHILQIIGLSQSNNLDVDDRRWRCILAGGLAVTSLGAAALGLSFVLCRGRRAASPASTDARLSGSPPSMVLIDPPVHVTQYMGLRHEDTDMIA